VKGLQQGTRIEPVDPKCGVRSATWASWAMPGVGPARPPPGIPDDNHDYSSRTDVQGARNAVQGALARPLYKDRPKRQPGARLRVEFRNSQYPGRELPPVIQVCCCASVAPSAPIEESW